MSGIAIVMMVLFMLVIWGGLAIALVNLAKNPDETAGTLGAGENVTDKILAAQEEQ